MKDPFDITDRELLNVINSVFRDFGIPELQKNGYVESPFKTSWYGQYDSNIRGYAYELCKLTEHNQLHIIRASMHKGEKRITIKLNIFELNEKLNSIEQLRDCDGINFNLSPNDSTSMQLRNDDYKGPPLFYMLFLPEHKLGNIRSKSNFEREVAKLSHLIRKDMANITSFTQRWFELYKPYLTDKEGNIVEK